MTDLDHKGLLHHWHCSPQVFRGHYPAGSLDLCGQVSAMLRIQSIRALCADGIQQVREVGADAAGLIHCWRSPAALPVGLVESVPKSRLLHQPAQQCISVLTLSLQSPGSCMPMIICSI